MTVWKLTIDISAPWAGVNADRITAKEFCGQMVAILKAQLPRVSRLGDHVERELEEILDEFTFLSSDSEASTRMVDSLLDQLYDFGDRECVWIEKGI